MAKSQHKLGKAVYLALVAHCFSLTIACNSVRTTQAIPSPFVQTPSPTVTAIPSATPSPEPASPTPTPTPSRTATLTPSPTPTFTPTPDPAQLALEASVAIIPGGTFDMGWDSTTLYIECQTFRSGCRKAWFTPSTPLHTVSIKRFYLDLFEITNTAFVRFLNTLDNPNTGCLDEACVLLEQNRIRLEGNQYVLTVAAFADHPVYAVTWYGAAAYCQAQGGRLPTEAEWEYAASFDPVSDKKQEYPWGNSFDPTVANFCDQECGFSHADSSQNDGFARTSPVGSFEKGRSPFGVYDLGGNVWEWVKDFFDATYYPKSPEANPQGPENGSQHVVRGGSWFDSGNFLSAVFRTGISPLEPDDTVGFRCAYDELPNR